MPTSPSLFLSLPAETLDLILSFAVPSTLSARVRRRQLSKYLSIDPSLSPIVRRRLFHKVTLTVGDPEGSDVKLLQLVELGGGEVGKYIKYVKVRLPDPPPESSRKEIDLTRDPALAILPAPTLEQKETVERVARLFARIKGMRYLELDARVGTRVEGEPIVSFNCELLNLLSRRLTILPSLLLANEYGR
jgi:hypothetical protein